MSDDQDEGSGVNPDPETLRQDQRADVAAASGRTSEADDHRKLMDIPEPKIDEKKPEPEKDDADKGDSDGGKGVDPKENREARMKRGRSRKNVQEKAEDIPEPEYAEPLNLPNAGGVNPDAIRERRSKGTYRSKPKPPPPPEPIPEPDFDAEYLAADRTREEMWDAIRRDRARRPPGESSPDNDAEVLTPQGNDKDLNDMLIESQRRYLEQERKYRQTMLDVWEKAFAALVSDHKRLEQIEAAFERGRESY